MIYTNFDKFPTELITKCMKLEVAVLRNPSELVIAYIDFGQLLYPTYFDNLKKFDSIFCPGSLKKEPLLPKHLQNKDIINVLSFENEIIIQSYKVIINSDIDYSFNHLEASIYNKARSELKW